MAAQQNKTVGLVPKKQQAAPRRGGVSAEVKLDPKNPIPFEVGGRSFNTVMNTRYIPFLPPLNNFPLTLLEASILSPTHQACIATKTNYCIGEGYIPTLLDGGVDRDPLLKEWLSACNAKRQPLHYVGRRSFGSFFRFGNVPVEVVCGSAGGKKFVYVYVKNLLDCRLADQDEHTGEPTSVIISRQFRRTLGGSPLEFQGQKGVIPLYKRGGFGNKKYWKVEGNVKRTMLWIKNPMEGYDDYGMPSAVASLIFQLLEYGGARYNLDNVENNMTPGGAIVLSGSLDQGETNKLARQILHQHVGAGKRGRIAVFSSPQGIQDSKFLKFDTKNEGSFEKMDHTCQTKILLANEWDAILAGLQPPGSLGKGSGYLQEVYFQKLKTVIRPAQVTNLDEFMAPLLEIADAHFGTRWSEYGMDIQAAQIINKASELNTTAQGLLAFMTVVEAVASGSYPLDAAVAMVADRFGLSTEQAKAQLGNINVRPQPTQPANANNFPGGNQAGGQ